MEVYCLSFVICLHIVSCGNGDALVHNSQNNFKEKGSMQRFKRYDRCPLSFSANGYYPLKKENVVVEFLGADQNYVARVKWKIPKVTKVPIDEFAVSWTGSILTDCEVFSNETSTCDIWPSTLRWKRGDTLRIIIQPLPMKAGDYDIDMLSFTQGPTTYNQSSTSPMSGTDGMASDDDRKHQDEYGVKLIIGSIIGVAIAVVLIIILVHRFCGGGEPKQHSEDTFYVSYYAESDNFVKEVKEFVYWLHANGFNVQMLTDENDMLSVKNQKKRRELMQFKFRQHMLETIDKVFIILSPSYLKLCQIQKEDAENQNFSENEKLVNDEIVQIRWELRENMYQSERFIPILFRITEKAGIPFWIKELVLYSWPEAKANNKLLNRLRDLPECSRTTFA